LGRKKIKQILDELGMAELWLSQNTTNISIHHIKQRIFDIYHQTWKTSVDESHRLSTYSWYKIVLTQEIYLDKIHTQIQNSFHTIQSFITRLTHRKRQTPQH